MGVTPPPDERIAAEAACARLVAAAAYYVDQRHYDAFAALFAETGELRRPDVTARGRDEILALMRRRPTDVETRHVCSPPAFLEVGADEARAVTYFVFHRAEASGEGPALERGPSAVAEYHDRFRRVGDDWRIAAREVRLAFAPS